VGIRMGKERWAEKYGRYIMNTISVRSDKKKRYIIVFLSLLLGTYLLTMNVYGESKEKLQGTWIFIAYEKDGVSLPKEQIMDAKLQVVFLGDKMIQRHNGNALSEATYKTKDSRTPKTIDAIKTNGIVEKGIYMLEGDILTICMSKPGYPRPLKFITKAGSENMLFRLQRFLPIQPFSSAVSLTDADIIFKENSKAVVAVTAYDENGNAIGIGSGFFVRRDGAVVTNYHVIGRAKDIKVKAGNKVLDVEGLIFIDEANDLVILKVKAKNMPVVKFGAIERTNIGDHVYVISCPEGYENINSDGLLSGIDIKKGILQTTAFASPGCSGSPVFNKNGEVIGVVTFGDVSSTRNTSFAMSVELIKDRINGKRVTTIKESELANYKNTAGYWFFIGVAYSESEMYEQAIVSLEKVIRINPDFPMAHYNLGIAYINLGMYKEAIVSFKQAIRIDPNYAEAYCNLGIAYINTGMYKEATNSYKQAIMIDPDFIEAYYNLGNAYKKSGMYKEAVEAYKQAIKINHNYAEAHNNLGIAYINLGMYKEAIVSFKQAIRIDPNYAEAHCNLGLDYINTGMYKEAIVSLKEAIKINPDFIGIHFRLGIAYKKSGMYKEAVEAYKQATRANPDNPEVYSNLGYVYGKLRMYKEAIRSFKQAIMNDPDYVKAHYNLGYAYVLLNDTDTALEQYKILKDLNPEIANKLFDKIYK
jgi:uncharacterized protein (TIGR03067 family)